MLAVFPDKLYGFHTEKAHRLKKEILLQFPKTVSHSVHVNPKQNPESVSAQSAVRNSWGRFPFKAILSS